MQGANRTGRPFTGDYAGDLLYATLLEYGFAKGIYQARPDDGLKLVDCRISNAVRCVPPQNKPLPAEINTCRQFLSATIATMPKLRAIVALGRIAHDSTVKALGLRKPPSPFGHGAVHQAGHIGLYDSYHCSRYNTNTGVLTPEMFREVFAKVRANLGEICRVGKGALAPCPPSNARSQVGGHAFALPTLRNQAGFSFSHASTSPAFRSGGNTG